MRLQIDKKGVARITIPQDVIKAMNWKNGTDIIFNCFETNRVEMREIK